MCPFCRNRAQPLVPEEARWPSPRRKPATRVRVAGQRRGVDCVRAAPRCRPCWRAGRGSRRRSRVFRRDLGQPARIEGEFHPLHRLDGRPPPKAGLSGDRDADGLRAQIEAHQPAALAGSLLRQSPAMGPHRSLRRTGQGGRRQHSSTASASGRFGKDRPRLVIDGAGVLGATQHDLRPDQARPSLRGGPPSVASRWATPAPSPRSWRPGPRTPCPARPSISSAVGPRGAPGLRASRARRHVDPREERPPPRSACGSGLQPWRVGGGFGHQVAPDRKGEVGPPCWAYISPA